jgi:arylsulfatase A-like enzyme
MTGTMPRTHGDRCFNETLGMPDMSTMAQTFYDAGYQTYAVGKLHVYPQRDRIGFGDVILNEEGRHHLGLQADDYELFLAAEGYAGQEFAHGMCNNDYMTRPWHLPEYLHATNWTVREMCRTIKRRDPTRPAFWYVSFNYPHPPLVPLTVYLELYRQVDIPDPFIGDWAREFESLPYALKTRRDTWPGVGSIEPKSARRAFYALCTHIDHQLRLVIGTLREEGLLDNTIIAFTADHGDMLGNHGLLAKSLFYEDSAKVPLILVPTAEYAQLGHHCVDDRLVELRDVMPTLLEMADIPVPDTVEGISLLGDNQRDQLFGEFEEGETATRMLRDDRYKLIYYPVGNRVQLFDLRKDPNERFDLADDPTYAAVREELSRKMIEHFYGSDSSWVRDGKLVGWPDKAYKPAPNRTLAAQRGWRFM